jgi:multidrug efflux system outer membrane protein
MGTAPTGQGSGTLGLNWLLDPYGSHRADTRRAAAGIEVAEAELAAARLLVLNTLASAYIDLRYRQTLLALADREMRGRRETLAMTQTLMAAEDATRLDIIRTQARVAELEAQLPGLRAAVQAQKNQVAVLVGVAPGSLGVSLDQQSAQPRPQLSPNVGIPADLLRNRPDIRIAERRYYIALAALTQAEAALYPRLSLAGAISVKLTEGGRSASDYYFGPALQLPLIPGRAARAGVTAARARIAAAHGEWKASVLAALLEVENALLDYQAATQALRASDKAAGLYRESLALTRKVFTQGDATLGDLIDAEQALAQAERSQAENLYQRGLSYVALNVRLGAGNGVKAAP